jgi:hypothetical protein
MGNKKPDILSDKARALSDEIAALEAEIKRLDTQMTRTPGPKFRSTAMPPGSAMTSGPDKTKAAVPKPRAAETVFEEIKRGPLTPGPETDGPEIYNDLGLRRYDLPALWQRIRSHFQGPSTSNPRLVSYLAAGGVQGLQPLRYEKRKARYRFLLTAAGLLVVISGLFFYIFHRH